MVCHSLIWVGEVTKAERISLRNAASLESQLSDNIAMVLVRCACSKECNTSHCKSYKAWRAYSYENYENFGINQSCLIVKNIK